MDVCFIPIIYCSTMRSEVLFTEYHLSSVACNGIIHSPRCFFTTLLSVTSPFLIWKSHRSLILSYRWQTQSQKHCSAVNFVQRHLRFMFISKLCILTASHIFKDTMSHKRKNEQLPQIICGREKKIQLPRAALVTYSLHTTNPSFSFPNSLLTQ